MSARFFVCDHCGNLITTLHDAGVPMLCCGEKLRELIPNTVVQAFATSIDALAVGVSFAALDVNIAAAASFIACVPFVCCLAGHLLGKKFGNWMAGKA